MFRACSVLTICVGMTVTAMALGDEPTQAQCLEAVDRAARKAEGRRPEDPIRLDAESLLRRALGEAGSQEYDECLDLSEQADCLLESPAEQGSACGTPH